MKSSALPIIILTCVAISGCAASSDRYPSLAIRDAERQTGTFTPVAPDPVPATSAQTIRRIDSVLETAGALNQSFLDATPGARNIVRNARNRGIESDARSRALVALADLTSLHAQLGSALGDLDRLEAEAALVFDATAEIESAQQRLASWLAQQDEILDSLSAELGT